MSTHSAKTKKLSILLVLAIILTTIIPGRVMTASAEETASVASVPPSEPTVIPTEVPTEVPAETPSGIPASTITPEATPTAEPTATVAPTVTPTETPAATPTPTPTKAPFLPETLKIMKSYDYVGKSVTGISSKKAAVSTLQNKLKAFGTLYGTGMPYEEYKSAMSYQWTDATDYKNKPVKISVDITKTMDYQTYVSTLKKLSRYDGVYLYKIGKSTEGRDLYAIEIDVPSTRTKKVIMQSGQVHAREFAGGTFIVKEFVDLVQKAQTDPKTMNLLKSYKYVAVPIINVDGREALITARNKWTTAGGELWKAYTNGTDGNRNFPGLSWGEVAAGNRRLSIIAGRPAYANFPGYYAGSNKETKAMMKWLYQYVVVEKASIYLDMHEQGSIVYAGKGWQTWEQDQRCRNLRTSFLNFVNQGTSKRKYTRVYESSAYGLQGEGSSLTDYAATLAVGAKFSPAFGYSAFTDGYKEYMLMQIKDLDLKKINVKPANNNIAILTVEIGYGANYLGNSSSTRNLLASEYKNYQFDRLLSALPGMIQ